MNKLRKAKKIWRYAEKKNAWESIGVEVKVLLGINNDTEELVKARGERKRLRVETAHLIYCLLLGGNPYEVKKAITEIKLSKELFEEYNANVNMLTNKAQDIDLLCQILRAI